MKTFNAVEFLKFLQILGVGMNTLAIPLHNVGVVTPNLPRELRPRFSHHSYVQQYNFNACCSSLVQLYTEQPLTINVTVLYDVIVSGK